MRLLLLLEQFMMVMLKFAKSFILIVDVCMCTISLIRLVLSEE
jgi:hypothetical protein